ncbi:hypothetical protein AYK21_05360 [Thermoplasmatales archaeon SG8-52-2]|nr:MAG: hypothetical protein AYK21_05360 [Thermoplasmatales archaeon SG8-52-2]
MIKKLEKDERFRKFFNLQYTKIKRTAAVGSLIMLILNLSFTIYPFIEHRGVHPYFAIPIIFLLIFLLVWLAAHIYVKKFEMYRTESLADKIYNPYSVYAIGPFEEMKYRNFDIVIMEALYDNLPDGSKKHELGEQIKKVKRWCDLGYIPKQEFPQHLKKYYITKKESRL